MVSRSKSFSPFVLFAIVFLSFDFIQAIPSYAGPSFGIPTETPTEVPPLPDLLNITQDANHELRRIVRNMSNDVCLTIQAGKGNLYCVDRNLGDRVEIYELSPGLTDQVRPQLQSGLARFFILSETKPLVDLAVDSDESIYVMYDANDINWILEFSPHYSGTKNNFHAYIQNMLLLDEGDLIEGTEPSYMLNIYDMYGNYGVYNSGPAKDRSIHALIDLGPVKISDSIIGRQNYLCLLTEGDDSSTKILIYEYNQIRELTPEGILPGYVPCQFAYLEMEQSFYIAAENMDQEFALFRVSGDGLSTEKVGDIGYIHSMVSSKDGRSLYFTNPLTEDKSAIYAYTYTGPEIIPTPTFTQTPTSTFTPVPTPTNSLTPTNSPTPTETPTPTPTPTIVLRPISVPDYRIDFDSYFQNPELFLDFYQIVFYNQFDTDLLFLNPSGFNGPAIHPISGEFLFQNAYNPSQFYSVPYPNRPVDCRQIEPSFVNENAENLVLRAVHPDGSLYGYRYSDIQRVVLDEFFETISIDASILDIHIVTETDRIPGTNTGDVLILGEKPGGITGIWRINHEETLTGIFEAEPLLPDEDIPAYPKDWTIGPGGALYLLTYDLWQVRNSEIYRLDMDNKFREAFHFSFGGGCYAFTYLPADHAFYFLKIVRKYYYENLYGLMRIPEDGSTITDVQYSTGEIANLSTSPDGTSLYLTYRDIQNPEWNNIQALHYRGEVVTPTPTPSEPTPTPTPIPGWFVLDGFGGIHSSNPELERPLLPYFAPYNIVRDIEPDPLGRGWYMLDGLGVVHTSSPDLPRPVNLPYFGFDIARNLEIVSTDHGLEFYMLDGYGTVHTSTEEPFEYGELPWFGSDLARDLEPNPKGEGWLILDAFGFLHSTHWPIYDFPLGISFVPNPMARGMVRFPDETTVLINAYGGRHTNPFYPAADVINGLPPEFYFYGFDIIWDVETVPATQQ